MKSCLKLLNHILQGAFQLDQRLLCLPGIVIRVGPWFILTEAYKLQSGAFWTTAGIVWGIALHSQTRANRACFILSSTFGFAVVLFCCAALTSFWWLVCALTSLCSTIWRLAYIHIALGPCL